VTESMRLLLVEQDDALRHRVAWWLETAGFSVMTCRGPSAPEYECVGFKRGGCPLAHGTDLVVLDVWTAADSAVRGRGGLSLLRYYSGQGLPVVAIRQRDDPLDLRFDSAVASVEWPPDRRELIETVNVLLGEAGTPVARTIVLEG
jgi:DNA-binding response OmpR family regulator